MPFQNFNKPCSRRILQHSCKTCSIEFCDSENLISHLAEHSSSESFYCNICEFPFDNRDFYVNHLKKELIHQRDLHQVACSGHYDLLNQFLHRQRADQTGDSHKTDGKLDTSQHVGYSPMHCVTFGDHSRSLKILLSWDDGNPNCRDPVDGQTPVHIAASKGFVRCLKLLLKSGGNLFAKDKQGKSPLAVANESCRVVIFQHYIAEMMLVCGDSLPSFAEYFFQLDKRNLEQFEEKIKEVSDEIDKEKGKASEAIALRQRMEIQRHSFCLALSQYQTSKDGNEIFAREVKEEPSRVPYEILARGKEATKAFQNAVKEETATVSHIQLTVLGQVEAGKTSLVRMLSGQEFQATRQETHGINTSMVEGTELNTSWHIIDCNISHVDKVIAKIVSNKIWNAVIASNRGIEGVRKSLELFALPDSPTIDLPEGYSEGDPFAIAAASGTNNPCLRREMPCEEIEKLLREGCREQDNRNGQVKVTLWDFAGHRLYEPMHHVFLNRRSMYLVVFSLVKFKQDQKSVLDSLYYWLNSIRVHTPRCTPIFLVGTHLNNVSLDDVKFADKVLTTHFGETFYQQLVHSSESSFLFPVENSLPNTEKGVELLKERIIREASQLDHIKEELPIRWLHFEDRILQHSRPPFNKKFVLKEDLLQSLRQECTMDEEEFEKMLQFFHDTGVIILPDELIGPSCSSHFPLLKDHVVLEPQYLVDVMTRIYDIPKNSGMKRKFSGQWKRLKNQGVACCQLMEHAWEDFGNSNTITGLLVASGMLCPLLASTSQSSEVGSVEEKREYIVPCHLRKKIFGDKWAEKISGFKGPDEILYFDFNPFMPPSLFHHLVVRIILHSELTKGKKPKIARTEGVFSFGNEFVFKLELLLRHNQFKVLARVKDTQQGPPRLLKILVELVTDVCSQYFKFLKFIAGPPCPNPKCPGMEDDDLRLGSLSSSESSAEEEETDAKDGTQEPKQATAGSTVVEKRAHVISVNPDSAPHTIWCGNEQVQNNPKVEQWYSCRNTVKCANGHHSKATKPIALKLVDVNPSVIENVARMLGFVVFGTGSVQMIARKYGMEEVYVRSLDNQTAGKQLLEFLAAKKPDLTVSDFCHVLGTQNRNDIVQFLTTQVFDVENERLEDSS